jgi:hypothetical protein
VNLIVPHLAAMLRMSQASIRSMVRNHPSTNPLPYRKERLPTRRCLQDAGPRMRLSAKPNNVAEVGAGSRMRSFLVACLLAALVAAGAAYVLDTYVQKSASTAFSTQGTRL